MLFEIETKTTREKFLVSLRSAFSTICVENPNEWLKTIIYCESPQNNGLISHFCRLRCRILCSETMFVTSVSLDRNNHGKLTSIKAKLCSCRYSVGSNCKYFREPIHCTWWGANGKNVNNLEGFSQQRSIYICKLRSVKLNQSSETFSSRLSLNYF